MVNVNDKKCGGWFMAPGTENVSDTIARHRMQDDRWDAICGPKYA